MVLAKGGNETMHYQIYLDSLFIQEVIVNFYVLELCRLSLVSTATHKRLILASVFAGGYQVLLLCVSFPENIVLFYSLVFVFYILGGFLASLIAFGKNTIKVYIKRITHYMTCMLIIGGVFMGILPQFSFYNRSEVKAILFLGMGAVVYVLIGHMLRKRRATTYYGKLQLCHGTIVTEGRYFMDSGNGLVESISGKPVLIADGTWLFDKFKKDDLMCRPVIYKSVGKQRGILYAYCVDKLVIYGESKAYTYEKVWIGVCREELLKNGDYQVILPLFYGTHYE